MLYQYLLVTPDAGQGAGQFPVVCRAHEIVGKARELLISTGVAEVEIWQGLERIGTVSGSDSG